MNRFKCIVFLLLITTIYASGQALNKFFRKDYTFLEDTQSFYKIHTIKKNWWDAKRTCALEGARLFYPEDSWEFDAVAKLWGKTQPFDFIFIGVSALNAPGVFETIDGIQVIDVYNKWAPSQPNSEGTNPYCVTLKRSEGTINDDNCDKFLPFICKKTYASLEWNNDCSTPYKDYVFVNQLERCYKMHLIPRNWTEAYAVCAGEQSYLTVINNEHELEYIKGMIAKSPKDYIRGDYIRGIILLGFHNKFNEGWRTVKGTKIEDSGYAEWAYTEPNGGVNEKCGALYHGGGLNDIGCDRKSLFICEHEIPPRFEERFDNTATK